jgi:hypothetical protein
MAELKEIEMTEEKHTIVLEDLDSAIVLSAEGNLDMYLPDVDFLPETGQMILSIAVKLHDEDFRNELLDFFEEKAKEIIAQQEIDPEDLEVTDEDLDIDLDDENLEFDFTPEGSDDKVF